MPTLVKKIRRTRKEYDSDGMMIPYHVTYQTRKNKKPSDPFKTPTKKKNKITSYAKGCKGVSEASESVKSDSQKIVYNLDQQFSIEEVEPPCNTDGFTKFYQSDKWSEVKEVKPPCNTGVSQSIEQYQ